MSDLQRRLGRASILGLVEPALHRVLAGSIVLEKQSQILFALKSAQEKKQNRRNNQSHFAVDKESSIVDRRRKAAELTMKVKVKRRVVERAEATNLAQNDLASSVVRVKRRQFDTPRQHFELHHQRKQNRSSTKENAFAFRRRCRTRVVSNCLTSPRSGPVATDFLIVVR